MKNKKGFTLVELLAVIVILALIMGIAVVSIGGVLNNARQSTFKETALSIINGVRQQATIANELDPGYYYFTVNLLEKGGTDAPLGGEYAFAANVDTGTSDQCPGGTKIGTNLCRLASTATAPTCSASATSFVHITETANNTLQASICLTAGSGNKYINDTEGTEANLLDSNDVTMIK